MFKCYNVYLFKEIAMTFVQDSPALRSYFVLDFPANVVSESNPECQVHPRPEPYQASALSTTSKLPTGFITCIDFRVLSDVLKPV